MDHCDQDGPRPPSEATFGRALLANRQKSPPGAEPFKTDEPPAVERLGEWRAPLLVVLGEHDVHHVTSGGKMMAERVAGARLNAIADAAHVPNMDHPDEFNRVVLGFLQEVSAAR